MNLFRRKPTQESTATEGDSALVQIVERTQAVIHFKPDSTILNANDNFLAALGYSLDEIQGQSHRMFVDEAYGNSNEYKEFWDTLRSGEFVTDQFPRVRKDGQTIWIRATYAPVISADGTVEKVIKIAQDVTHRQMGIFAISKALDELKSGNLAHRVPNLQDPDISPLGLAYNDAVNHINSVFMQVQSVSVSITQTGQQVNSNAQDLSRRAETQAATLEETAAAVEELTSSASASANNARSVEETAANTRNAAKDGGQVVSDVIDAMSKIENSSEEIAQIITVIDDIAFQTNLLSLNAGVEAARAGEAGRGFAVVASEVRSLAQRTAESAKEIKSLISESSDHVTNGANLVHRASSELNSIFDGVGVISDNIRGISEGLVEQASTLTEINTAVSEMDHNTQNYAATALEATSFSKTLLDASETLAQEVTGFKTQHMQGDLGTWEDHTNGSEHRMVG